MLTLKDCTKVQSKIRMLSPCLSSLISLAARQSFRKLTLTLFNCRRQRKLHLTLQNTDSLLHARTELRACSVSVLRATRQRTSILSAALPYSRRCTNEAVEWTDIFLGDIKMRAALKTSMKFKIFSRKAKLSPKKGWN